MKIAWVTHRVWDASAGGAEAADVQMVERSNEVISEVLLVGPGGVDSDLKQYDRVIVTGMYGFSDRELNMISDLKPVIWLHDTQFEGHWLLEAARHVIMLTPAHMEYELEKTPLLKREKCSLNPGWFDTTGFIRPPTEMKQDFALWAHRPEPHKGLDLAAEWALKNKKQLEVVVASPRDKVRRMMQLASHFILLSHIFDPGPRSVMEAQLCGCELVLDKVGYWDEEAEALRARIDTADRNFWNTVALS